MHVERIPVTTMSMLKAVIKDLSYSREPIVIEADPGVGKTSLIYQIAAEENEQVCEIRVPLHEASDLKFPIVDVAAKTIDWVQSLLPHDRDWKGKILADELGQGAKPMQAAMLGLFQNTERRIGSYTLPAGAQVIATTNRMSNKAGCHAFISPLISRVCMIDFQPDTSRSLSAKTYNDEWCEYVNGRDLPAAGDVVSFVRAFPNRLLDFNAERIGDSPTPRAWESLARCLAPNIRSTDRIICDGIVGPSAASEFCAFRELTVKIDPAAIIANPDTTSIPTDQPSMLWAMVGAVSRFAKNGNGKELENIVKFLTRCPAEYAVFGVIDAMALNKGITQAPSFMGDFIRKHGPLIANKA